MIIGYGKLSRAWSLTNSGTVGAGDTEVQRMLLRLAKAHPENEYRLVTVNSGERPTDAGYPPNVSNPWRKNGELAERRRVRLRGRNAPLHPEEIPGVVRDLTDIARPAFEDVDAYVMWIGHHGSSNSPLPSVRRSAAAADWTRPYDNFILYGSYLLRLLNEWRDADPVAREEVWLCADPRNYIKARDLKWPQLQPVLAQFDFDRKTTHYRYEDPLSPRDERFRRVITDWDDTNWMSNVTYEASDIELSAVESPSSVQFNGEWENRFDFGMLLSENKADVRDNRKQALKDWVLPYWPDCEIFGKWSDKSLEELDRKDIRPCPHKHMIPTIQRWRCTLTTPASGSGWATAKPWEAFAAGTVCFFHPGYDTQNHVLSDAPQALRDWLRVESPDQLRKRVDALCSNPDAWRWLVGAQREHFDNRYEASHGGIIAVEKRLGLL